MHISARARSFRSYRDSVATGVGLAMGLVHKLPGEDGGIVLVCHSGVGVHSRQHFLQRVVDMSDSSENASPVTYVREWIVYEYMSKVHGETLIMYLDVILVPRSKHGVGVKRIIVRQIQAFLAPPDSVLRLSSVRIVVVDQTHHKSHVVLLSLVYGVIQCLHVSITNHFTP